MSHESVLKKPDTVPYSILFFDKETANYSKITVFCSQPAGPKTSEPTWFLKAETTECTSMERRWPCMWRVEACYLTASCMLTWVPSNLPAPWYQNPHCPMIRAWEKRWANPAFKEWSLFLINCVHINVGAIQTLCAEDVWTHTILMSRACYCRLKSTKVSWLSNRRAESEEHDCSALPHSTLWPPTSSSQWTPAEFIENTILQVWLWGKKQDSSMHNEDEALMTQKVPNTYLTSQKKNLE